MQEVNTDSKIKKGMLEYLVLLLLEKEILYSQEISEKLAAVELDTVDGTLYPLLNKMLKEGRIGYRWEESSSGPPRKYFHISSKGKKYFEQYQKSVDKVFSAIQKIKQGE